MFSRSVRTLSLGLFLLAASLLPREAAHAVQITSPEQEFGFAIGDDYHLANYTQLTKYWHKLAQESPRVSVVEIGKTAEGRPQLMAIITSPANHEQLDRYKGIAARLARAEGLPDEEARKLAAEGKAVVWIDGGLHATEVLGAHQLMELVYRLASAGDAETRRILDDVIVLAVHANPDGMELVSNWYMRDPDPEKRSTRGIPRLYQKYIGHDNNRDFYMVSQPETENMARVMFREWFPQIVYNHHQRGPAGTVMFAPPFRDPFNYNYDPLIPVGIEMVGAAMHSRMIAEGKAGTTLRSGAPYSTWWNGGLRTTAYFHNMIGLLTETIGNPTPINIPFVPDRYLPSSDKPLPIEPQQWHFRQSIEYSITANMAVLDYASRYRETLLYNIYRMGRNSIEHGRTDHWTTTPKHIDLVKDSLARLRASSEESGQDASKLFPLLRRPEDRDPRGYVITAGQPDFPTAGRFVNALIKNGIRVERATRDFEVAGKKYPAGSFVVKTDQAFRPHVLDMFEPQNHPNDFAYPGAAPTPPYDNAGWTLAYQMGITFDRVLDGFDGPFEELADTVRPSPGTVAHSGNAAGYLFSHASNNAAIATNRLLAAGHEVFWLGEDIATAGRSYPAGTIFVKSREGTGGMVAELALTLGLDFTGVSEVPAVTAFELAPVRIGLWDRYGGSMPSGWTRWLLEQFEFPFEVVYGGDLNKEDLNRKYDALVFVSGAIPGEMTSRRFRGRIDPGSVPKEYRHMLGDVSADTTVPRIMQFARNGGDVIAIGSSAYNLAKYADVGLGNQLVEIDPRKGEVPLPREKYYIPGSVLTTRVNNSEPLAYGMPPRVDVFFNRSPVFKLGPDARDRGVSVVAWFDKSNPLRSGWAWGSRYLKGGIAASRVAYGAGALDLFGPEILNRGQPAGAFKLFFNAIYLSTAKKVNLDGSVTTED